MIPPSPEIQVRNLSVILEPVISNQSLKAYFNFQRYLKSLVNAHIILCLIITTVLSFSSGLLTILLLLKQLPSTCCFSNIWDYHVMFYCSPWPGSKFFRKRNKVSFFLSLVFHLPLPCSGILCTDTKWLIVAYVQYVLTQLI